MAYKKRETKLPYEMTPEELVSRLQPIDFERYVNLIDEAIDLRQRRREIFSKYVPLYDEEGKRILKSYEIMKLAKGEPIEKLEDPISYGDFELKNYHIKKKKIKTDFRTEEVKVNVENDNEHEKSESDNSSESDNEEEADSENEYVDDHSSEDEDLDY